MSFSPWTKSPSRRLTVRPHRMEHSFQDFQRNIWRDVTPGAAAVQRFQPVDAGCVSAMDGILANSACLKPYIWPKWNNNMFIKFYDFTWNKGYYFFPASATFWGPMVVWGRYNLTNSGWLLFRNCFKLQTMDLFLGGLECSLRFLVSPFWETAASYVVVSLSSKAQTTRTTK